MRLAHVSDELRERLNRGTRRRDVLRGEAVDQTAAIGASAGGSVAQRFSGRLRTRAGRHGGVPEPGLGGVHYSGVAGPAGPGGTGRRVGPARTAVDRDVVPTGRLVPYPSQPVAASRTGIAGAQVLASVRAKHHAGAAENGPQGRVQRSKGRPQRCQRLVRPVPVRYATGEHVQHVRRRRNRRQTPCGNVPGVPATDGTSGNVGGPPSEEEKEASRRRRVAAQPVLASAT